MFRALIDQALVGLLPPTCVLCGAPGAAGLDLCTGCLDDLPRNSHACTRCALPLPVGTGAGAMCGPCQRQPPSYDSCHVPFLYRGGIRTLVAGIKFRGGLNQARLLGLCLARSLRESEGERPALITPVPLHPLRLRERGYNQALEIARTVTRELGIPVAPALCVRLRAITPQEGLDKEARRSNVRGAFEVQAPLRSRHIAILDDVVTTGSTAAEVATVLRQAGAKRIDLWALARTP